MRSRGADSAISRSDSFVFEVSPEPLARPVLELVDEGEDPLGTRRHPARSLDPEARRAARGAAGVERRSPHRVVVASRYRILEPLGRGGMGIVYKVEHTRIGKLLAMKLLTGELSRNPEVVRRFKHEALTVSRLSQPEHGAGLRLRRVGRAHVPGDGARRAARTLGRTLRAHGPMPCSRLGKTVIQVVQLARRGAREGHRPPRRQAREHHARRRRRRRRPTSPRCSTSAWRSCAKAKRLNDVTSQGAIVGTPYLHGARADPRRGGGRAHRHLRARRARCTARSPGTPVQRADADVGVHEAPHRDAASHRPSARPSSRSRPASAGS